MLLYAQRLAAISRLTLDDIDTSGDTVELRLGTVPVMLPEPLATLVRDLVATRHGHAATGDHGTSQWLFPGGQPGRPVSADRLGERLRLLGIRPGQARSTALFQLATELPAAVLARMLGIHIKVAVQWQHVSAGDWTSYAADVSRRTDNSQRQAIRTVLISDCAVKGRHRRSKRKRSTGPRTAGTKPGRYKPTDDKLIAFLQDL